MTVDQHPDAEGIRVVGDAHNGSDNDCQIKRAILNFEIGAMP